jgi:hypothetical protein
LIHRYLRALAGALRLTLRGEPAPVTAVRPTHPAYADWALRVIGACDAVYKAAQTAELSVSTVVVHADGRDHSMEIILNGIRFHAGEEYPYMLRGGDRFAPLAVSASNLNDRFLVSRLREQLPPVLHPPLDALSQALESLPPLAPS